MANLTVYDMNKKEVGKVTVPDSVFAAEVSEALVHQVVVAQQAGKRSGNAHTKTKGEVRGGGKKPFKQKGTGRARQGSIRSPLLVGGGTVFGPRKRSYEQKVPKKMAAGALRSALSDRFAADRILVIDNFKLDAPKTKTMAEVLEKKLGVKKALLVDKGNVNLSLSVRNMPKTKYLESDGINVFDIIAHDWLVISKEAVEQVGARLDKTAKKAEKTA